MSHMVIFKTSEGKSAYHQAAGLDEAVRFMEHLRNSESVESAKLFHLTEVPVQFKTYFKVEVGEGKAEEAVEAPAAPSEEASAVEEALAGAAADDAEDRADKEQRRGLFSR